MSRPQDTAQFGFCLLLIKTKSKSKTEFPVLQDSICRDVRAKLPMQQKVLKTCLTDSSVFSEENDIKII